MSKSDEVTFDQVWDYICNNLTSEQQAIYLQRVDDALRSKGGKLLDDDVRKELDRKGENWVREHLI